MISEDPKCTYKGNSYAIGTFITKDCQQKCECKRIGSDYLGIQCQSLCPMNDYICLPSEKTEFVNTPVAGSSCTCSTRVCKPGMRISRNEYTYQFKRLKE